MADINDSNKSFIKEVFGYSEDKVRKNYPEYNYRLRLAGFTEYNPYISESPQQEGEADDFYQARVNSSGKYFGEQEILMDNVLYSEENINGLKIDSQFLDGKIPKTLLFLEECKLIKEEQEDGTFLDVYEVTSKSLNEKKKVKSHEPFVTFPVELPETANDKDHADYENDKKGYLVFRKKDLVTKIDPTVPLGKDSNTLLHISSGWDQITGFSSDDIASIAGGAGSISDRIRAAGFTDNNHDAVENSYSGYESFENETETKYKVIDSGIYYSPTKDDELTKNRVIDLNLKSQGSAYYSDGKEAKDHSDKSYTLERKITRESNTEDFPAKWEVIEHNASFPYTDSEDLSDQVQQNVNFRISGVYDIIKPTGNESQSDKDYFEVDLLEDWGKGTDNTRVTNREDTKDLVFRSGESLKVIQKSTRKFTTVNNYDQYNSLDIHFNPYSTGQSGCVTGLGNELNFYELEYQLVRKKKSPEKLYYETGEGLNVGDLVFLNTGSFLDQEGETVYDSIESDVFGGVAEALKAEENVSEQISAEDFEQEAISNYFIDFGSEIRPESVAQNAESGVGYSYFESGQKYVVVPKGGYNTLESEINTSYYSAGETFKSFFQGEQRNSDVEAQYALTEYRTFDDAPFTEEKFLHKNEREIRISERSICLGDSATDLQDFYSTQPSYILDRARREYPTYNTFTNASILNIDSDNGEVKISELKDSKKEFLNGVNLFFEKNYVASLTVLATGQKQDINALASFMEKGKKYYIERDIYVDSDVYTQANFTSPVFSSSETAKGINPFSVDVSTPNPFSVGQEKHYLTQVYHEDHDSFPYNDYDYYNSQAEICEEYTYINTKESIISDFLINNISEARSYYPNRYESAISATSHTAIPSESYSVLMNTGVHDSWPEAGGVSVSPLDSDNNTSVTFKASNVGSYYEIQHRQSASSDWETFSHAILATSESSNIVEKVIDPHNVTASNYRILEWFPSSVMLNYEGVSLPNETPDSLILQGATSGPRIYDISKQEHSITNNGVTVPSTNTFDFDGSASLTIPSHRSLDIQNGEFSFEFYLNHSSANIGSGTILEREGAVKIYIESTLTGPVEDRKSNLKVDFNGVNVINYDIFSLDFQVAKHIAICKHVVNNSRDTVSTLSLFIQGEGEQQANSIRVFKNNEISYGDYSFNSTKDLVIGSGLTAKILHFRFYSGSSIYKDVDSFTRPTLGNNLLPFTSESRPRRYKILKLNYNRIRKEKKNWIINKNIFDNVNPPWDYEVSDQEEPDETTKHSYEWLAQASNNQNRAANRAMVNYLEQYAYRAPNNPHINKNYDGTPIEIKDNEALDLNSLVSPETYHYRVRRGGDAAAEFFNPAPYYYEYKGSSDIYKIRNSNKGGEDNSTIPRLSQLNGSFKNGSRLRVTKYVYRLYTKHAVVVGDSGFKNSRSSQQGWDYQLQYSIDSGTTWEDIDSTLSYEDYVVFMNEDGSYAPNSFENINHCFVLPTLVSKTDITEKYTPEQIRFRIEKKQILDISSLGTDVEVFKKLNPLPFEVNIPVTGALLDLTQKAASDTDSKQEGFSTLNGEFLTVNLDSSQDYVLQKDSNEKILLTADEDDPLKVRSINRDNFILNEKLTEEQAEKKQKDGFDDLGAYTDLKDGKPYVINGLDKIFIQRDSASSKEDFKSVVGVKPSGINISRKEKSYKTNYTASKSHGSEEFDTISGLDVTQTKFFFTPNITGSHFDELQGMTNDAIIDFSSTSFVTGNNEVSVSSGVAGLNFEPVHKFRKDIMTGKFLVDANDNGKTFLCSGSNASGIISHEGDYSFNVFNLSDNAVELFKTEADSFSSPLHTLSPAVGTEFSYRDSSLTSGTMTGVVTPLPTVSESSSEGTEDLFLLDKVSGVTLGSFPNKDFMLVNTSEKTCKVGGSIELGSMSGIHFNKNGTRKTSVDSGVLVINHDEIVLTKDDNGLTGVIDTDSTLVLPTGFSNGQSVTFLNSTNHEAKVISASGYGINEGGSTAKSVYYIPKNEAVKFSLNHDNLNSNIDWTASSIDVIKYNQLEVANSIADNKVYIHDEDVDVRVASNFSSKSFSVVRSKINDINFSDLRSQKTPILRVFVGDKLKYTAKPGVLGVRVTHDGSKFTFEDIDVIANDRVSISPSSHNKVFCYSGSTEEVTFLFSEADYANNFEFFLITNKSKFDLSVYFDSEGGVYKFNDDKDSGFFLHEVSGMDTTVMLRVSKSKKQSGTEIAGSNRFFIETVGQKGIGEKSSNIFSTSQDANSKDQVVINRNRGLGIKLPKLDSSYDYSKPYNLLYVNASETSSDIKYPREAVSEEGVINDDVLESQNSFSTKLYNYKKQETSISPYENFIQTDVYQGHNKKIKNGDVAIIDGSLTSVNLKSFLNEEFTITNKFSEDEENLVRQISCDEDDANVLILPNHGLVTNQRLNFLCDRLTNVDYYWNGNLATLDDVNAIGGADLVEGDTVLLKEGGSYFLYVYEGVDGGGIGQYTQIVLSVPESEEGLFEDLSEGYTFPDADFSNKLFFRINKGSDVTNVESGDIFDFADDAITHGDDLREDTNESIASIFSTAFSDDSDDGVNKTQTYFVEVIDQNRFKLYRNKNSTNILSIASTDFDANKYFLSDLFYASDIECSRADIVNLGDGDEALKTYEDNVTITTAHHEKVADLFSHKDGSYTSGEFVQSGVYLATGYNGSSDGLNIADMSNFRHIVSSGKFHTRSSDLTAHNNDYFINSDLESVEINGTTRLNKNRAYKYSSSPSPGDPNFGPQNPSLSTSDILYYPKNEIHIPNRKSLTKNQNSRKFDYNFVFVNSQVYNEDLLVVLPSDDWTGNLEKVAVVNMGKMPVTVVDFDRTETQVVNANSVVFISNEDFDDVPQHAIVNNVATLGDDDYTFSSEDGFIDDAAVTLGSTKEAYYISHAGDIILDYSVQNDKTIFIEDNVRFRAPYQYSSDGATNYVSSNIYQPVSASSYFNFELINLSTKVKQELFGQYEIQPKVVYDVSIENFEIEPDNPEQELDIRYFKSNSNNQDKATKINHAQTNLDSNFDYHVFGKELRLDLSVYYRALTQSESEVVNYMLGLDEENMIKASDQSHFKIEGIGYVNNSTLTIANNVYENIKINSVTLVGDGLSEDEISDSLTYKQNLENKILNYFADQSTYYDQEEILSGQTQTLITTAITENYLEKNKVLKLSIEDLITEDFYLRVFNNLGEVIEESDELQYINVNKDSNVIHLKKDNVQFNLEQSGDEDNPHFRYVLTSPANVYLPSRKDMSEYSSDVFFTIVNASRESCDVICPEGTSVLANQTLTSDSAIKIKWEKSTNTFSEVTNSITVNSLAKALFSCDYGAFLVQQTNTSSTPLLIHSDIEQVKIINNTGSEFYIKHYDYDSDNTKTIEGADVNGNLSITKFRHSNIRNNGSKFVIDQKIQNIDFDRIRDSVSLSKGLHENKVVLFDAATIKSFSVTESSFFATTFVPLIRLKEFNDGDSILAGQELIRGRAFALEYSVANGADETSFIKSYSPCSFGVNGTNTILDVTCNLYEFILDSSINDKIIMTNRHYDFIALNSANTAFSLFANLDFINDNNEVKIRKLDADGFKFSLIENDDGSFSTFELLGTTEDADNNNFDITTKNIFSVSQAGTNFTLSNQQTYTDYITEGDLIKTFYANKTEYKNKILVFKEPFLISCSDNQETVIVNDSDFDCRIDNSLFLREGLKFISAAIKKSKTNDFHNYSEDVSRPKYSLGVADKTKLNVLNHAADVTFTGNISGLRLVNASASSIKCNDKIIYSLEAAKYISEDDISYSMCPTFYRKDWFIKLKDIDIIHQELDTGYYNEKEAQYERLTETRGANVEYKGTRYKLSNIFNTNIYEPKEYSSGYESISKFNSRYKYGVSFYGNKKGQKKKIEYDTNFTSYALSGLKLPWDMPDSVVAYSINTGHERISYCKEFDERNGLVTLSGIDAKRRYVVEDFEETFYNLVFSAARKDSESSSEAAKYPFYKYESNVEGEAIPSVKFQPRIKYNGKFYAPGEVFEGQEGITDYQVEYIYFAELKANQFISSLENLGDNLVEEIKKATEEYDKEISNKIKDSSSGVIAPIWSKVPAAGINRSDFKVAKVEEKVSASANKELIQGKKIKDIQGAYIGNAFEFKIPYDETYSQITKSLQDGEIIFQNEKDDAYKVDGYYNFRVIFNDTRPYPGREYEIKSSFKVTNSSSKDLLTLSLKTQDSSPFVADETIRSLNLDFNTDAGQESVMLQGGTYDSSFSKRVAVSQGSGKKTLKNSIGYSFIPFNRYGQNFYGLSFISSFDKQNYSSVRFRLKKLTDKKLFFEDLKEGSPDDNTDKTGLATYLDKGTSNLQYTLDTEVESISYHDIARPGGVLKMSYPEWISAEIESSKLKIDKQLSNGDAIVFQHDSGLIKRGQPYFVRFSTAWSPGSDPSAKVEVLRIFSTDTSIDSHNVIPVANGITGNKYKIVNYFHLDYETEDSHRSKQSILKQTYFSEPASSPTTSLNYPVVVGSINLYLEAPLTSVSDVVIDKWGSYDGMSGEKLRFNLELSTISKRWHGEDNSGGSFSVEAGLDEKYIDNPDSHWVNEDIFSSYKNLLYRANTQMDLVEVDEDVSKITIKLNTNTNYRYIYKGGIKKVTLNSVELSASGGTIYNTNEDLLIELNATIDEDNDFYQTPKGDENTDIIKNIYENLCIVELAEYVDTNPNEDDANINKIDYLDYQIPSLNSDEGVGSGYSVFKNVYPSYFTEDSHSLLSYGDKADNLVDYDRNGFTADLMYDMGMPAICEYVYLDFVNKNSLSFSITNFWDGFEHKFEGPSQYYKVKPTGFDYTLQQSSDGQSWSDLETGEKGKKEDDRNFKINTGIDLNSSNKFRMKINSIAIQYRNPDESSTKIYLPATLDKFRLPFKWSSIIKDSELGNGQLDTDSELYMHSISMPENYKIGKSVSFPESGFTKFGEFNFVSGGISYTRLYMINFEHSLRANYKDPIKRGGISKVVLTNRGQNYRTEPTITIPAPTEDGGTQATASAIIEDGKLKHIEVSNSGSGYSKLSSETDELRRRIETSRASSIPVITHTLEITSHTERKISYSDPIEAFKAQTGLEVINVTFTNNESSLPKEVQEEFGLTLEQTEKIEEYLKDENNVLRKSRDAASVDLIKGTPEDDDWAFIQDVADSVQKRANISSEILSQIEDSDGYGSDFYEEDSLGTENEFVDGLYQEDSSDSNLTANLSNTIKVDSNGDAVVIYETHPSVVTASALAFANNSSVADYRVIDNEYAAKATPWLSSFDRTDNPSLPKSFGIIPGSAISPEVFNSYARALNYLTKIRIEAPIYAKIRRYKQIEWRYISNPNMAGLTFTSANDAGEAKFEYGDLNTSFDYYTHEDAFSKVNYIAYLDPVDNKLKVAHFSGYTGDGSASNKDNIHELEGDESSKIWDIFESKIKKETDEGKKFEVVDDTKTPNGIGLPNIVNIPTEMGVYCNPSIAYDRSKFLVTKGEGVPLPTPVNKRAFAYGGDLVYTSPVYDVSSDPYPLIEDASKSEIGELGYDDFGTVEGSSLVDIRGSKNYIKAGYQNQIVFGCQTNGKPFWSAFLRTTKVWTEYEIVSSPEFTESLPEGIRDKYKPEESKLRCVLTNKRVSCSNDTIGKVDKNTGYHSICSEGAKSFNRQHSYEDTFNLSDGDDVIGPKSSISEGAVMIQAEAKGTLSVEPEFDLSLAVYSANETIKAIRAGAYHPNDFIGPCIHYCMPGQIRSLQVSEDPLVFDLSK